MVELTELAAKMLKETISMRNNPENTLLIIEVIGCGWAGRKYKLTLDELNNENYVVIESRGIKIAYNLSIKQYVNDSVIDYVNNGVQSGYIIKGAKTPYCKH